MNGIMDLSINNRTQINNGFDKDMNGGFLIIVYGVVTVLICRIHIDVFFLDDYSALLRFSICIGDPYVKRKIGCLNKDAPRGVVNPWVL